MASSSSSSAKTETKSEVGHRSGPYGRATGKVDWHAVAKKEWAAGKYREAAAAWTWALAGVRVTRQPAFELERMLYMRNRSKAYLKTDQCTLALDDIDWVLRMQGVWNGSGIDVNVQTRHAYFVKCVAAYAAELARLIDAKSGARPESESWLESTAYMTKPDVFNALFCRTLDDLEHFATALERFANVRAAALIYKLLAGIDRRSTDAHSKWTARMVRTAAAEEEGKAAKESVPVRTVRNQPHQLTATQQETLKTLQESSGKFVKLEDIRLVWYDWNIAARQYAGGIGDNQIAHAPNSILWRLEYHTTTSPSATVTATGPEDVGDVGSREGGRGREGGQQRRVTKTKRARVKKVAGHIECRWTSDYGRAVYATQGFSKGDVVWIESPSAAATVDIETCVHCARQVLQKNKAAFRCVSCGDSALYCSDACRTADAKVHVALCGMDTRQWQTSVAEHGVSTGSRHPFVIMRILARRIADSHVAASSSPLLSSSEAPSSSSSSSASSSASLSSSSSSSSSSSLSSSTSLLSTSLSSSVESAQALELGYTFPPVYGAADLWTSGWLHTLRSTPSELGVMRDQIYDMYSRNRDRFAGHPFMHPQVYNFANFHACSSIVTTFGFSFDTAALNDIPTAPSFTAPATTTVIPTGATDSGATKRRRATSSSSVPPLPPRSDDDATGKGDVRSLWKFGGEEKETASRMAPRNCVASGIGLYNVGANFNHSCEPNVTWTHPSEEDDLPRNVIVFTATRDIAKSEQLFISYIDVDKSYEERQIALTGYQFECRCAKCLLKI